MSWKYTQQPMWWTGSSWYNGEEYLDKESWEEDWVFTEAGKIAGVKHLFCKLPKGQLIYVCGNKPLPHS